MFFSGIADEASPRLADQIRAHQELGFEHIELRMVDGKQLTALSDREFDAVRSELDAAGLQVSCFASAIANWARPISNDLQTDIDDLERNLTRMQALGCPYIRVMSWPNAGLSQEEWKDEAVRRMRRLAQIAEQGQVTLVLENCDGWAAQSSKHMLEFLRAVDSPALRVVFDTGNAPGHAQNSLEMYVTVKPYVSYVHIKDAYLDTDGRAHYVWPSEGHGYVRQILADLVQSEYGGGVSIEPHLKAVVHEGKSADTEGQAYQVYVEYGRRLKALVDELQAERPTP